MKEIIFDKIVNQDIFSTDFNNFIENNSVTFSNEGICIVYGPNGTGKTSFIKVLDKQKNTEYKISYEGKIYTTKDDVGLFHIVGDQNNRNIISGETTDFLLGDNIKREYELKKECYIEKEKLLSEFGGEIKKSFSITSASSSLIDLLDNNIDIKKFVKSVANIKTKGTDYTDDMLLSLIDTISVKEINDYDKEKLQYLIFDYQQKTSIIKQVLELKSSTITINEEIEQVEENTDALKILQKFHSKTKCIVCDNDNIDSTCLIHKKEANRTRIVNLIDDKLKEMINQLIDSDFSNDVFNIKHILIETISTGNIELLSSLKKEIKAYQIIFEELINNLFVDKFQKSRFKELYLEYKALIDSKPEINEEDLMYIQEIVNNSMSKKLRLDRDENKNIKIFLSDKEFINKKREDLPLSSGEQNFLSLTFEFLKAKKSSAEIIVIDDPISSFDSIYKNKVVYSLIKILQNKLRLIFTHNLDFVRLIAAQYKNCYTFYILNNCSEGTQNGFVKLTNKEQQLLIDLKELLNMFRKDIREKIENPELYLISMIPFMRGYSNVIGDVQSYESLTNVMHGYMTGKVDIADIYYSLFKDELKGVLPEHYLINVSDILSKNFDSAIIVKDMPILNRTLRHSAIYLSLRLLVEKVLVNKYGIDTNENKQLGQIISKSFPEDGDPIQVRNRVFFTSKKTLINEFNHFEGNLSIFQPAIDITEKALSNEKSLIEQKIIELQS